MESSQSVLNPAIPEIDNTDETIPGAEEPNNGFNEESKNEMNEQQESGIINQGIEGEDPVKSLSGIGDEEPSLIPDEETSISSGVKENVISSRKQSQRSIHLSQRSQQSVGHQSLPSPMLLQQQPSKEVVTKGSVAWISQRTGKEMKCKFNQTSVIWERKPLAEILHPSSTRPQISKDTEKDEAEAQETITPVQDTETEQGAMQESVHSMQPLEETEGQDGSPSPVKEELEHAQQPEDQASQHGSQHKIVSQSPQDMMEGDIKLISKKTGKEMKCSFNQTSFVWERKPLAEILHPQSTKTLSLEKDTASPEVEEIKQALVQEVFPGTLQVEEQELQDGSQQLEAQETGKEAPEEVPEALEEAPEAPKEALESKDTAPETPEVAPEEGSEAPKALEETPEEAPEALEETPEEAPKAPEDGAEASEALEETLEEAPQTSEAAPEVLEDTPEEAPKAPEDGAEALEETLEEAPKAPEETLGAPEEAPAEGPEEAPEAAEEAPES